MDNDRGVTTHILDGELLSNDDEKDRDLRHALTRMPLFALTETGPSGCDRGPAARRLTTPLHLRALRLRKFLHGRLRLCRDLFRGLLVWWGPPLHAARAAEH